MMVVIDDDNGAARHECGMNLSSIASMAVPSLT
jgi:hypothetical protein